MKAIVIDAFGGPDRLRVAEVPTPKPAAGEVLIELACTSVNPVDWKIREGMLGGLFPHAFPLILGWDAAGTVSDIGETATGLSVGERVYAYCRKPTVQWGTYAEYVAVPASAVAAMPANLSFAEAAAIPLVGLTSWQALIETANLRAGQSVLIHAGAGGLGSMAIQLAKNAGATVFTTASAANHEYVRSLGADHAIDYRSENFYEAVASLAPAGIDVIFATIGGDTHHNSYIAAKRGGVLVSVVEPPDPLEAAFFGVRPAYVFVEPNGAQLSEIGRLLESGAIRPPDITEMPLEDAASAQTKSRDGHVRGKIVLRVREDR